MKRLISILAVGILLNSSCTKIQDPLYDSVNENDFPENLTQLAIVPSPAYKQMQYFLDGGGWWFAQELTSDEMVCPTRHTDWADGGKWAVLHTHEWTNTTEAVSSMWGNFIDGTRFANKIIERLQELPQTESSIISISKMKILRSYYYYLLIDNYGDVPYVTKFKDAVAEPEKEPRATIFNNITQEIAKELQVIPIAQISKYSVTRAMAYSLLAKLYLNSEVYTGTPQWEKAGKYCDTLMTLGYALEPNALGPFITMNENSTENIWTIPFDEDKFKGFNLHMRTLHYNSNLTFDMPVGPWNGFAVTESHYNSYPLGDKRKGYFLVGQQYDIGGKPINDVAAGNLPLIFNPYIPKLIMDASNTPEEIRMSGARVVKFEIKKGAKADLSNDFPIFRYADILLMKAEAEIRQGRSGDEWVNMIRERAGLNDLSGVTLTQLLEERGREMFWEAHRRQDQIRFGTFNEEGWYKPASDPSRKIFPIPQWAVDVNPNLAK